jgi:hypothetical protein
MAFDESADLKPVVDGLQEFIAVILPPVRFAVHFCIGRGFYSQRRVLFEAGVELRDDRHESVPVRLVFEVSKIFDGSLFGGQAWAWAVRFDNADLSFDGAVFVCFGVFSNQRSSPQGYYSITQDAIG